MNLIVSDSFEKIKVLVPQKEFNFGTTDQIYSDCPQFRVASPDNSTFKKLTLYKSLKFEDFLIVGCFKQLQNEKEIEVPAPPEKQVEEQEEEQKDEDKPKPFMLEKPGFPPLKPIIPVSNT